MTKEVKPFKPFIAIWLVLMLPPLLILLSGQNIFPLVDLSSHGAYALYAITMTGTSPYFILTIIGLFALSYFIMPKTTWLRFVLAAVVSLGLSTSINVLLKAYFKEPRPNMVYLSQQDKSVLDLETFYQLERAERAQIMQQTLQVYTDLKQDVDNSNLQPTTIFKSLQNHWQHEVGYSFPSGHTIFSATLVLTTSYYLLLAGVLSIGSRVLLAALIGWGIAMGASRMLLGMHWPQDVLASTALAIVFSLVGIGVSDKSFRRKDNKVK